jgi:hypothetical protein
MTILAGFSSSRQPVPASVDLRQALGRIATGQ